MPDALPNALEFVRPRWLNQVARDLQCMAGDATIWSTEARPSSLIERVGRLPAPSTPVESLLLRGLLWESAYRIGSALHALEHRNARVRCALDEDDMLLTSFASGVLDGRHAFADWATRFCRVLDHLHPPSGARRAAAVIRRTFPQPLNIEDLARSVHMTASGLRRAFHGEFGRSPRAYQAAVRLLHAIEQVEVGNIEGIALEVGYRSRKNFYRMFKTLTGLTPTAFRTIADNERRDVMAKAWKEVQWGRVTKAYPRR